MNKIRLEKINDDNFYEITKLKVSKEQKNFVATNTYSLVHAYLALVNGQSVFPFGIFVNDKPVGFLMIGYNAMSDDVMNNPVCGWFMKDSYMIWRLMIDKRYQNKGYGKEAVRLALDFIRTYPCGKAKYCWLSYEPENKTAKKLYQSFGFEEVPSAYYEGGEMPAILEL